MFGLCHQEHGFDGVVQLPIHSHHLELVFKVRNSAQTAKDQVRSYIAGAINQQILERMHHNLGARLF